jgi:hypothetical protein
MLRAPLDESDSRLLGIGSSKAIWVKIPNAELVPHPREDTVIVNSLQKQRTLFGKTDRHIEKYYKHQENEYNFTRYLNSLFPHLIPNVEPSPEILPVGPFRYLKERCYPLPLKTDLFYHMIHITDAFAYLGWAYLDMKPPNLGFRDKKIMLLDTDPYCFYKVPKKYQSFYKISCHMIILLFCLNHVPQIPHAVLRAFIDIRGYSLETFSEAYKKAEEYDKNFLAIINDIVLENPKYILNKSIVKLPKDFFDAYGNKGGKTALERLESLLEETIEPFHIKRLMNFSCDVSIDDRIAFSIEHPMGKSKTPVENSLNNWQENALKGPKGTSLNGPRV